MSSTYKPIPDEKPKDCMSFAAYVYCVVQTWGPNSVEFQNLLKFHTKEYLREVYAKERDRRKALKEETTKNG